MHTIILEDFGLFLGKTGERFVVKKKGKKVAEFPASDVERILISSSGASLSSAAVYLAVDNRVPVAFTYSSGRPFAFLTPTSGHGTVLTRRNQYMNAETTAATHLSSAFIKGKLKNQRNLLYTWAKNRTRTQPATSDKLFDLVTEIDVISEEINEIEGNMSSKKRNSLMNIEGRAASQYWNGASLVIPPEFNFPGRETRGASDPFNMLLNYGYGILYSEVWTAVSKAGLDPFAGFLHVDRPGRPSMVLDLIEEFRQQVVDRTIMAMVTKGKLAFGDVLSDDELSEKCRNMLASDIISRLEERVNYEGKSIQIKNVIVRQAWAVSRFLRGESTKYEPFTLRW